MKPPHIVVTCPKCQVQTTFSVRALQYAEFKASCLSCGEPFDTPPTEEKKPARKCFVVRSQHLIKQLQTVLGVDWTVIAAGGSVMGMQFDTIVLSSGWGERVLNPGDWYTTQLMTRRRSKESEVIHL
jgi:hypothetical protein